MRCDNLDCRCCGQSAHKLCSSYSFKEVTHIFNERLGIYKSVVDQVFEIDRDLIKEIEGSQKILMNSDFGNVEPAFQQIVQKLYK